MRVDNLVVKSAMILAAEKAGRTAGSTVAQTVDWKAVQRAAQLAA